MTHAYPSPSNPTENTFTTATTAALREEAATILAARGLDLELIASLGWRSGRSDNGGEVWLEIPYFVNGIEVNCKSRTIAGEKRFHQVKDGQKVFYNASAIDDWQNGTDPLLICEGEMDCVTALQCGFQAVSVPDGAPAKRVDDMGSAKYTYLEGFPKMGTVIICADGDAAGANLLHDLADRLGIHRCKWIKYPQGCKDLNEVLVKYGERGVHETIKRADWLEVKGLCTFDDLPPSPPREPMSCGIMPINMRTGEMSIWSGMPSHGKTTLLNQIAVIIAKTGRKIAVASFEQDAQLELRGNLRTLYLGIDPKNASQDELNQADRWIQKHFCLIIPPQDFDEDTDLAWLLEKMVAAVIRHEVSVIIIDPWNELDHCFDRREMTTTDYTGFAVKQLKKFARRYRVHVAVVAHPAKMRRDKDGSYPVPTLYDIADSAHWANKPDLGVIVHKQEENTLVRVQKSRYWKHIGKAGDYPMNYNMEKQTFEPIDESAPVYSYGDRP